MAFDIEINADVTLTATIANLPTGLQLVEGLLTSATLYEIEKYSRTSGLNSSILTYDSVTGALVYTISSLTVFAGTILTIPYLE